MTFKAFNYTKLNPKHEDLLLAALQEKIIFLQQLVVYSCIFLFILFFISIFLNLVATKNKFFSILFSFVKFLNMTTISLIFITVFVKFNTYI